MGAPPDPQSQQTARARGVDISDQRARSVHPDNFETFDLILAMDTGHYRDRERACPGGNTENIRLFMDYAPETGITDVPDPYYGDGDSFDRVFDMIETASKGLLAEMETHHTPDR